MQEILNSDSIVAEKKILNKTMIPRIPKKRLEYPLDLAFRDSSTYL